MSEDEAFQEVQSRLGRVFGEHALSVAEVEGTLRAVASLIELDRDQFITACASAWDRMQTS